jgi:hypothetical protein
MNPLEFDPFMCCFGDIASSIGGKAQDLQILPPRRTRSCLGRVELVSDILKEPFSLRRDASTSIPSLKRTISDPSRTRTLFVVQQQDPESPSLSYQKELQYQHDLPRNVWTQSLVKNFFEEHPTDLFLKKAFQKIACDLFSFERENLTHPAIALPKKQALEMHIQSYREKYGISIHLGTLDQLLTLFDLTRNYLIKPGYESFIIAKGPLDLEEGHVMPLLISFDGQDTECLIMDVIGSRGDLVGAVLSKLVRVIPEDHIFIATGGRQSDTFSCRTGALSLLRNAHLSLRYHNFEKGLRDSLQRLSGRPLDRNNILLPSEWTYVEQIPNGPEGQIAIRDCFSKKMEKKLNPRTVKIFRDQHTEQVRFRCTISNSKDYRADFNGLIPPDGVRAEIQEHGFSLVFETAVAINTYLLHKGFQRAGLSEQRSVG